MTDDLDRLPASSRDVLQGAVLALAAFALYAAGACRTIFTGDSAEMATAAAVFGIPHPPGYPLYTLLTGTLVRVLPVQSPAFAANLATAGYAAAAVGGWFVLLRRLGVSPPSAWIGTLGLALGRTFWGQSLAAEVYSLDVLLLVLVLHVVLPRRHARRSGELLLGLAVGLWLGHRIVNLIYLPSIVLVGWTYGRRIRGRAAGALAAGLALASIPMLYLPVASAADPFLDMGDPQTWSGFAWVINPAEAYRHHLDSGTAALTLGRVARFVSELPYEAGVAIFLAPIGAYFVLRRDRRLGAALLWLVVAGAAFAARYNIPDVQVYYLPCYVGLAGLAAFGADAILPRTTVGRRVVVAILVLGAAAMLAANRTANDLSRQRIMHTMATDLLGAVEPGAVVLVRGDNTETGPGYVQAVEDVGREVIVLDPLQWDGFDWYRRGIANRHPEDDLLRAAAAARVPPSSPDLIRDLARSRPIYSTYSPEVTEHLAGLRFWPAGLVELLAPPDRPPDPARVIRGAGRLIEAADRLERPGSDLNARVIYASYAFALLNTGGALLVYYDEPAGAALAFEAILRMDPDPFVRDVYASRRAVGQDQEEVLPGRQAREALARIDAAAARAP